MMIMGIDPGIARIGWSIIDAEKSTVSAKAYGLIQTDKTETPQRRLRILFESMEHLLNKYSPNVVSIEDLFFATNVKTAIAVGQAKGILLLACAQKNIPVVSYKPLEIKRAICGNGHADKKQVECMVVRILKLTSAPKPDDVTDALAIALTYMYMHKMKGIGV